MKNPANGLRAAYDFSAQSGGVVSKIKATIGLRSNKIRVELNHRPFQYDPYDRGEVGPLHVDVLVFRIDKRGIVKAKFNHHTQSTSQHGLGLTSDFDSSSELAQRISPDFRAALKKHKEAFLKGFKDQNSWVFDDAIDDIWRRAILELAHPEQLFASPQDRIQNAPVVRTELGATKKDLHGLDRLRQVAHRTRSAVTHSR